MFALLSEKEIKSLKKARVGNKTSMVKIIGSIFMVVFLNYSDDKNEILKYNHWIKPVLFLIPTLVLLSGVRDFFLFYLDFKNKKKIVLKAYCKINSYSSDVVSHHLIIEGYGEIDLVNYNYNNYFKEFSELNELYEIHFAPKTKTILYVKKMNEGVG